MTNKKFIEDMTKEERTEVFSRNEALQHKVLDDMLDGEMHWISEKLDYIRDALADWSVGTGSKPYISPITDNVGMQKLLDGLKKMDSEVPAFNDDKAQEVIGDLEKALTAYLEADAYDEEQDYEEVLEKAEAAARKAADELAAQFERDLNGCFGHDAQLDYFLEFYADARMDDEETYYIIPEEGTFSLYEDVAYTKSYQ